MPRRSEAGSTTLLVLMLLALFLGIGFAFRQTMGLEGRIVAGHADRQQAQECARAGVEIALALLRADDPGFDALSDAWAASPLLRGQLAEGATYTVVGSEQLPDNGIHDIESRLSINALPESVLPRIPGLSARALLEVVNVRRAGPIRTLHRFMDLTELDERSFTRAVALAPSQVLTVHGSSGSVNVNTASPFALGVVLGDEALAQQLVVRRRGADGLDGTADDQPWRSQGELQAQLQAASTARLAPDAAVPPPAVGAPADTGSAAALLTVRSSLYSITATGEVRSGTAYVRARLRALAERSEAGAVRVISCSEL
jgi:type II secretory pathway component PulK